MNNMFDALEICLQELDHGTDMEAVLARFPNHASELRPILKASAKARTMNAFAAEPSQDAIRRGRARVMQRAAEMRESSSKAAPRKRIIPAFQRLAFSFALAALFLMSGTGLLNASASALPGERLYPVKRSWEGLRLLLIFNKGAREALEDEFEYERLDEVTELLTEGRDETIQFAGVFTQVNDVSYVSGVQVILPAGAQTFVDGDAVILSGQTNDQGFVVITNVDRLPEGSIVPLGNPIVMEAESESETSPEPGEVATEPTPQYFAMKGTLESISTTTLVINGLTVYLENTQIEGEICPGMQVEVKGYFADNGRYIVAKLEGEGSCLNDDGGNSNSNTNTNPENGNEGNGNGNTNSNTNTNGNTNTNTNGNGNTNNKKTN